MHRKERDLEMMEATGCIRSTRLLGVGMGSGGGRGLRGNCLVGHSGQMTFIGDFSHQTVCAN